jgi:hypothetical protein
MERRATRLSPIRRLKPVLLWLTIALTAMTFASCTQSPSTSSGSSSTTAITAPVGTNTTWVKDSTSALNVFLPDEGSIYWTDSYRTANGARTVVSGQVPQRRTGRSWRIPRRSIGPTVDTRSPSPRSALV